MYKGRWGRCRAPVLKSGNRGTRGNEMLDRDRIYVRLRSAYLCIVFPEAEELLRVILIGQQGATIGALVTQIS